MNAENNDVVQENAELIHRTVLAISADEYIPDLEIILAQAEANGWEVLVAAIKKILGGERDLSQLTGLDEEDRTIVTAVLEGIEDSSSLPDLTSAIDPAVAGPSMANMILGAVAGNAGALEAINGVSQQMGSATGDFAKVPDAFNLMVTGERREEILCGAMGVTGTTLIQAVLEELKKLEA